jgi:hypothetical protein
VPGRKLLGKRLHHHPTCIRGAVVGVPGPGNYLVHRSDADDLASGARHLRDDTAAQEFAYSLAGAQELTAAVSAAVGFMSTAVTLAAPARAAAKARMPDPVPTSATRLPRKSSRPMTDAKNSLVMKWRG